VPAGGACWPADCCRRLLAPLRAHGLHAAAPCMWWASGWLCCVDADRAPSRVVACVLPYWGSLLPFFVPVAHTVLCSATVSESSCMRTLINQRRLGVLGSKEQAASMLQATLQGWACAPASVSSVGWRNHPASVPTALGGPTAAVC
jgi:hypothetical protein